MPTQSRKKGNAGVTQSPRQTGAQRSGGKPGQAGYRPHTPDRSLGYARKRDIEDSASQQSAPRGPGHYDRRGEDEYAGGLEEFEEEGGATAKPAGKPTATSTKANWELDEGDVRFGGKRRRGSNADVGQPRDSNADRSRTHRTR